MFDIFVTAVVLLVVGAWCYSLRETRHRPPYQIRINGKWQWRR